MYIADAAWSIGDFEYVKSCAQSLVNDFHLYPHPGHIYLGLLALKEHNIEEAKRCLASCLDIGPSSEVCTLLEQLFLLGERQSLVQFIDRAFTRVRQKQKTRWIEAINSNQLPDFAKGW